MHQVVIAYQAAHDTGPARRQLQRTLPQRWDECTPEQVWYCMDMIMRGMPRRQLVEYLLQLPQFIRVRISRDEMYDLQRCITWMDLDAASPAPVAPYIDISGSGRLYLPLTKLAYSTCREYMLLDSMYDIYMQSQTPDHECKLVALVARPAGPSPYSSSDPRILLQSEEHTAEWIHMVREMPESLRVYIVTLISALRRYVYETYKDFLFEPSTPPVTDEMAEHVSDDDDGLNFGWMGAFMDVASDGLFGSYEQVLDSEFHTVCVHMVRKVETARRHRIEDDHARLRSKYT